MPPYKNQHFLPVCYLREFTSDKGRTDRNAPLWRFDGKRSLHVTAKSQCAENYFYSEDDPQRAESVFGEMESIYSGCLAKFRSGFYPNKEDMTGLILMTFDIKLRNAAQQNETPHENFNAYCIRAQLFIKTILLGLVNREPKNGEALEHLHRNWKIRILRAAPEIEFLTSDNPSIWIASKEKNPTLEMTIMPLMPDRIAVAFDSRRKRVIGKVVSERDHEGLVRLQCRNSMAAVYTSQELCPSEEQAVAHCIKTDRNNPGTINENRWKADFIQLGRGVSFDFAKDR